MKNKSISKALNKGMVLLIAIVAITLVGCYEDKGSYDYKEVNEILLDTVGTGFVTEYTVAQFGQLKIDPTPIIKFSNLAIDEVNLSYKWSLFNNVWNATVSEVIGTEKVLDYTIKQESSSTSYSAMLEVTDKSSGLSSLIRFTVWVTSDVISGWVVLHGDGINSDLDYIASTSSVPTITATRHMRNIFSVSNSGAKIEGRANFVRTARRNNSVINAVFVGTDKDLYRLSGKTFQQTYSFDKQFTIAPTVRNPQKYEINSTHQYLINDGKIHNMANQSAWEITFSYALEPNSGIIGDIDFDIAPFVYTPDQFASTTGFGGVFYDNKVLRYYIAPNAYTPVVEITKFPEQLGAAFDVNNVGKELIYMDKGFNSYCYSILKDVVGDARWLYVANFNKKMDANVAISSHNMSGLTDIASARYFAVGNRGPVVLYATEKAIYTYDYTGSNSSVEIKNFNVGDEIITSMNIYKPGNVNGLNDANGAILYVATWDGTQGRVYEYSINESNGYLRQNEPLNIYSGMGRVADMCVKVQGVGSGS